MVKNNVSTNGRKGVVSNGVKGEVSNASVFDEDFEGSSELRDALRGHGLIVDVSGPGTLADSIAEVAKFCELEHVEVVRSDTNEILEEMIGQVRTIRKCDGRLRRAMDVLTGQESILDRLFGGREETSPADVSRDMYAAGMQMNDGIMRMVASHYADFQRASKRAAEFSTGLCSVETLRTYLTGKVAEKSLLLEQLNREIVAHKSKQPYRMLETRRQLERQILVMRKRLGDNTGFSASLASVRSSIEGNICRYSLSAQHSLTVYQELALSWKTFDTVVPMNINIVRESRAMDEVRRAAVIVRKASSNIEKCVAQAYDSLTRFMPDHFDSSVSSDNGFVRYL
ncbi:MAG TPA: hypothetical protein VJB87_03795 [Candidatus Nanoarchaeia archaeon]|nr:hypothetical protein [Candidatus Nanoarchaeia archaeon]